jgi:hypothetical protein
MYLLYHITLHKGALYLKANAPLSGYKHSAVTCSYIFTKAECENAEKVLGH